jgi:hypothetical protein
MKALVRSGLWLLPLLLLTACFHRTHKPQNQSLAPPIAGTVPPPAVTAPVPPPLTAPAAANQSAETPLPRLPERPIKSAHRRRHPASREVQQADIDDTPGVSAIGQLSTGDPSDLRGQTTDSITATERTLNNLNRGLSAQERRTAAQIREFLKQAKAALNSGDVDGAHTLALKAKVLLNELNP